MLPFIQGFILYPNIQIRNTFACSKNDAEDRAGNLETFSIVFSRTRFKIPSVMVIVLVRNDKSETERKEV